MPKGPSICTSTGFQKPSSNRGHGKYAQEQHFFDKTFTSSFLHSPCVVCINCLTPDKILPCNLGEKFIEYLPRNLESFRCAIYAFRVLKFILFASLHHLCKSTPQLALSTAEAVSRFIGHVCNAPSLKKIPIFVSFVFFLNICQSADRTEGNRRGSHTGVLTKPPPFISFHPS